MSLTCPGVCRIARENCQGFLAHHHCLDDITIANSPCSLFQATVFVFVCECARPCACVWVRVWICDRERNSLALYVIHCVKAPIPISMIISYSLWAKTATLIQFISPLLTGAEMLGPAEVTSEVFQSWGVAEFVLRVGWECYQYRVGDFERHASMIVYLPETRGLVSMNI